MTETNLLSLCKAGINRWQEAFNAQDAAGCASQYTSEAVMTAKPFGTFEGREQIQAFWQNIIDQGFKDVDYTDVQWQPIGDDGYLLSSKWTMNKAFGAVHREHWVIDTDGQARLLSDEFEVLGDR